MNHANGISIVECLLYVPSFATGELKQYFKFNVKKVAMCKVILIVSLALLAFVNNKMSKMKRMNVMCYLYVPKIVLPVD